MKINHAEVTYGELRSAGYPSFSNKRIEVTLGAFLESGADPEKITGYCRQEKKDEYINILKKEIVWEQGA